MFYTSLAILLLIFETVNLNEADNTTLYINTHKYDVVFLVDESQYYAQKAPILIEKIVNSGIFKFGVGPDDTRMGSVACGLPHYSPKDLSARSKEQVDGIIAGFKAAASTIGSEDVPVWQKGKRWRGFPNSWDSWRECIKFAFTLFDKNPEDKMRPRILFSKLYCNIVFYFATVL